MTKTSSGRFFEDYRLGESIHHATPRTITAADCAQYMALTGSRFGIQSASTMALSSGYLAQPVDDLLAFHIVFGKTVPDISLNAVANLGYAEGHFHSLVFPGDTIISRSDVIGLKENSNGKTGIVYVRTQGINQRGEPVISYVRWVMVRKNDTNLPSPETSIPELKKAVPAEDLVLPQNMGTFSLDPVLTGSHFTFEDYKQGERIDHVDGMGVMESEHRIATRLYQNTAKVHFNDHTEKQGRLGATIVYGGVVISLARALSFNGLSNVMHLAAINSGSHANPCIAGDTIYAWSEILEKTQLRDDAGALRIRMVATKNKPCQDFPYKDEQGRYLPDVLLDFDYWGIIPTKNGLKANNTI